MGKDTFIGTREAATLLGVALGTVQRMVDTGELEAWTTGGGHRRISRDSVMRVRESVTQLPRKKASLASKWELDLVLANTEPGQIEGIQSAVQHWEMPLRMATAEDALDVAVLCAMKRSRMVLLQVDAAKAEAIAAIRKLNILLKSQGTVLTIVTSEKHYEAVCNGITHLGIPAFKHTQNLDELKGFVRAQLMQT